METTTVEGPYVRVANSTHEYTSFVQDLMGIKPLGKDNEMVLPIPSPSFYEYMMQAPVRKLEEEDVQEIYNTFGRDNPFAKGWLQPDPKNEKKRMATRPAERVTDEEKDYVAPNGGEFMEE